MTWAGRAVLGAALGALLTLLIHPAARSFILSPLERTPSASLNKSVAVDLGTLPDPSNRLAAGAWMLVGAEKLTYGNLTRPEIRTLINLAGNAERVEPDNAYWFQMHAVLLAELGNQKAALVQWRRASQCKAWDDFQTERLVAERRRLSRLLGSNQSWIYGYVFFKRSDAAVALIDKYARSLISRLVTVSPDELTTRYATIRNGSLLRDGSRALALGARGTGIVERATYPPSLFLESPRRIWIAETTLTARLRQAGLSQQAEQAEQDFRVNESWIALTHRESPDDNIRNLCLEAVGMTVLPGALALASLGGWVIYFVARAGQDRLANMRFFPSYGAALAAVLLAGVAFIFSRSWAVAITVGLAVGFIAAGPSLPRKRRSNDLGPLFSFVLLCIWLVSSVTFAVCVTGSSTAAACLVPSLGPSGDYLAESPMFAGVTAIVLSLLCLVAPAWAIVHKYGTPDILGLALQRFGRTTALACLFLSVIVGPLAVYADGLLTRELQKILGNEPVYYLTQ